MINAIVAVNEDWGIGYNGDLLEHIPEDLKFFKTMTTDKTVVMGLNTWNSLPIKPLPNRFNIIIEPVECYKEQDKPIAHMDLGTFIGGLDDSEIFVIGGGSIYKQLLPYCDRVYVTKIYKKHENVDTFFPNLDESNDWTASPIGEAKDYEDFSYQFWQYDRKS